MRLHDLPRGVVARPLELLFGDALARLRHADLVAAKPPVEERHLDRDRHAVRGLVHGGPAGRAVGAHPSDVPPEVAPEDDARVELRLRLACVGFAGPNGGHARHEVGPLLERAIDQLSAVPGGKTADEARPATRMGVVGRTPIAWSSAMRASISADIVPRRSYAARAAASRPAALRSVRPARAPRLGGVLSVAASASEARAASIPGRR